MQFERITWDEALDEITTKWKAIIDEHGPQAIMPNSYLGNQGLVHGLKWWGFFFARWVQQLLKELFVAKVQLQLGY